MKNKYLEIERAVDRALARNNEKIQEMIYGALGKSTPVPTTPVFTTTQTVDPVRPQQTVPSVVVTPATVKQVNCPKCGNRFSTDVTKDVECPICHTKGRS